LQPLALDGTRASKPSYDYLLNMKFVSLTKESVDELAEKMQRQEARLEELRSRTAKECWEKDLDDFVSTYRELRQKPPAQLGRGETVLPKIFASVGHKGTTLVLEKPWENTGATKKTKAARKPSARASR